MEMDMSSKQESEERPGEVEPSVELSNPSCYRFSSISVPCSHAVYQPARTMRAVCRMPQSQHADVFVLAAFFLGNSLPCIPLQQNPNLSSMPILSVSNFKELLVIFFPSQTDVISCSSEHLKICTILLSTLIRALQWSRIDFNSIRA